MKREEAAKTYAIDNSLLGHEIPPYKGFLAGVDWVNGRIDIGKVTVLTKEFILGIEYFGETEKEGEPCLFNGDNIMLFNRKGYFDAYLHSEYDGSVFYAARLFTQDHFRNFYLGIERIDIYK